MQFKVETLTQQLHLSKDENERISTELNSKLEEFSKYRQDKHTELVRLQSSLDSLTQTHNQTLSQLRSLQSSHNAQSSQLSQALQKVQDLTGQLADQEAKYSSETANLQRLVRMMEERETHAKQLVSGIEKDWEGLHAAAAERERELSNALEEEQQRRDTLEKDLEDMRTVLDKINRGELPTPGAERMGALVLASDASAGMFQMSPSLALIDSMQKSGKSFTDVFKEYAELQRNYNQEIGGSGWPRNFD